MAPQAQPRLRASLDTGPPGAASPAPQLRRAPSADAQSQPCGAGYGERTTERVNRRNGYRERDWDTRVGSTELAVPKLRAGSYFPDWLPQPRRRAEQAFVSVIADAYLAGVWTSRVIEQNDEWRVAAATCRST